MVTKAVFRAALLAALAGCASPLIPGASGPRRFRIPHEMDPPADGQQRLRTVKLTEQGRSWELALPEWPAAYELRIPLGAGVAVTAPDAPAVTGSDAERRARLQAVEALFAGKRYQVALAELESLEKTAPGDARVWAMKGSVLRAMGERARAIEAWRRALSLNPADEAVTRALAELEDGGR